MRVALKVKQLLKLLVKRYAKYQRELCGRVELPRFNGAYRVARNAHRLGKLGLRHSHFRSGLLEIVFQYQLIFHSTPRKIRRNKAE